MATDTTDPISDIPASDISSGTEVKSLSPDAYVYTTPSDVEKFGNVPYNPPNMPKNNLSPPSDINLEKGEIFCGQKKNQGHTYCKNPKTFCDKNPKHRLCHEEDNPYQEYGFFADENKDMFVPELRNPVRKDVKKPLNNIYEEKLDDVQFDVPNVRMTQCKCKNGSVVQGYINMRNGQKDCSNCKNQRKSYPNAYKNYKTMPKVHTPRTDMQQPLRKQVGVSHFGDVNMRGCSVATDTNRTTLAENTLNRVVNTSNAPPKGSVITQKNTSPCMPKGYSLYDNCPMDIYGV